MTNMMEAKDQHHIALRVALQTMKERCVSLQRRLTSVEEENQKLRETQAPTMQHLHSSGTAVENFQLRLQLEDLQRQKAQLTEHINMVSNENLKLWSRLSQMAKEQGKWSGNVKDEACEDQTKSPRSSGGANQNLIRSKTFTQHSPNPHLRHKVVADEVTGHNDISLEEVALEANVLNDVNVLSHDVEYAENADAQLGFAYINVSEEHGTSTPVNEHDLNQETKKYIEGLQEIRREALHQQQELNTVIKVLEKRLTSPYVCPDCAQQKSKKPEMADKSLETDDSLSEIKFNGKTANNHNTKAHLSSSSTQAVNGHGGSGITETASTTKHINIIQEKIIADALDKTCPMCGRVYGNNITFDAFREHVEMHFVDDSLSDVETSIDRQFEMISHAVGDF